MTSTSLPSPSTPRAAPLAAGLWSGTTASVRGSVHEREGRPNQDAVALRVVSGRAGQAVLVAAVADGHGGQAYVRSDVGSRLAVDAACDAVAALLGAGPGLATLAQQLPGEVVSRWRAAVARHAAAVPFGRVERMRAPGDVAVAYGSTVLVTVAAPDAVLVGALGDGDVLAVDASGTTWSPLEADPGWPPG